jgi:hypothetical protein
MKEKHDNIVISAFILFTIVKSDFVDKASLVYQPNLHLVIIKVFSDELIVGDDGALQVIR